MRLAQKLFLFLLISVLSVYAVSAACTITAIADQTAQVNEAWVGLTATNATVCPAASLWIMQDDDGSGLTIVNTTGVVADDNVPTYAERGSYDIVIFYGNGSDNDTEDFEYTIEAYSAGDLPSVVIDNVTGLLAALFGFVAVIGLVFVWRYVKKR